jgi:hypothetical protein
MRLTLPDSLADAYSTLTRRNKTLESTLTRQLERFQDLPLEERVLVVRRADLEIIDHALRRSVTSGADLAGALVALTQVTIGGAALTLSQKTLEALQRRAVFESKDPEEVLQAFITEIETQVTSMVLS